MAGPRSMNGLDAEGNVLNGYYCFHDSPSVKEFASKFDGMAIVLETLRAAFDVHDRVQWCDVAVERMSELSKAFSKSSFVQPITSRITSSGGEQAIRVDARRPPEPSGSPRFQGRFSVPAASSTAACQSSSDKLGSSQMSRSPSSQSIPCNRSAPEPMMRYRFESWQGRLPRVSSELPQLRVHVGDCRINLFGSGLNAEECDQFIDHRFGIFGKLGEVDPMDGDFGISWMNFSRCSRSDR